MIEIRILIQFHLNLGAMNIILRLALLSAILRTSQAVVEINCNQKTENANTYVDIRLSAGCILIRLKKFTAPSARSPT